MRVTALALALLLLPVALPPAHADVSVLRVVAGDQTFQDGEFVFRDYLVVPPGSTLTFKNATVWLDATRLCTGRSNILLYRCQPHIDVRGTLVIEDSRFDTHLWRPSVDAGYIINADRGAMRITGSEFAHFLQVIAQGDGAAPTLIEGNRFHHGVGPVRFMSGSTAVFRGNVIESTYDGVRVTDAPATVERNVILNVTEKYDGAGTNWAIEVLAASPQDHVWPTTALIRGNTIDNATVGIVTQTGARTVIEDNVIRNVRAGMLIGVTQDGLVLDRTTPVVRRNLIDGATEGIRVSGAAASVTGPETTETLVLSDNALVGIACHGIRVLALTNAIHLTVDATGVWWGSGRGPQDASATCGVVRNDDDLTVIDTTPWARAPPKWLTPHLPGIMTG